jgi:hypothetical protein
VGVRRVFSGIQPTESEAKSRGINYRLVNMPMAAVLRWGRDRSPSPPPIGFWPSEAGMREGGAGEPGERWLYCYPDDVFAEY